MNLSATLPFSKRSEPDSESDLAYSEAAILGRMGLHLEGGSARFRILDPPPFIASMPDNLLAFVEANAFLLDKKPIEFVKHLYLKEVYADFDMARARKEGRHDEVIQAGAQVGKTGKAMLSAIFAALKLWGRNIGYFMPDRELADITSSNRFYPMAMSNPIVSGMLGESPSFGERGKKADDRKRVRTLGESTVYFSYMGGTTSTESIPMDALFLDEVRRMTMQDIQRAQERVSHADIPLIFKLSTAGYPDAEINYFFKRSTMHAWHSRCRCKEGVALAELFPDCLAVSGQDIYWRCPRCDKRIDHPGDGFYIPKQPESRIRGRHISQIASPAQTAATIWEKYTMATDRKEFYNSALGLPYVDPTTIPVPESVAKACIDDNARWLLKGVNCVMGVDQRGGENHVVIAQPRADGKLQPVHLEIIQGEDPFDRLYHLMTQYDVDCCVIDALPSYNESVKFAKKFKRRVFVAYYTDNAHMIRWSDRDGELKVLWAAQPDAKFEFHVFLDRYKAIEYALMLWVHRRVACPNPHALVQTVKVLGVPIQSHICLGNPENHEQGLFFHLRSVARKQLPVSRRDSKSGETVETGEFRMVWENIGVDPHFLHAWTYCAMAATRKTGGTEIWMPEAAGTPTPASIKEQKPHLSDRDAADLAQLKTRLPVISLAPEPTAATCAHCKNFQADIKLCQPKRMTTQPHYPACNDDYEAIEEEEA